MPDSIRQQLIAAAALLEKTSSSARLDAEILLAETLDWPRSRLYAHADERLSSAAKQRYLTMLSARATGRPVAYVLGNQEFWSLDFEVSPDCLVPRPETETLVEWALQHTAPEASVLDLGTGSGAIAIAIAHERPQWQVCAVDQSHSALEIAQRNATRHGCAVEFLHGSWFAPVAGRRFSLIVSNPPYVAQDDPHLAALKHEPQSALVSGPDGLQDIRKIIQQAPDYLHTGAWLALEHGADQAPAVRDLLHQRGFIALETLQDLAGLERISLGQWPMPNEAPEAVISGAR